MIDERTEILINRRLDGALSDEEALELDKLLIRNPQARVMLEACQRQDALASSLLRTALPLQEPAGGSSDPLTVPAAVHARGGWMFGRRVGILVASLLMAGMIGGAPGRWSADTARDGIDSSARNASAAFNGGGAVFDQPHQEQHQTNRDVIAVYDRETNSYYLLEMNHTQSTARPLTVNY